MMKLFGRLGVFEAKFLYYISYAFACKFNILYTDIPFESH